MLTEPSAAKATAARFRDYVSTPVLTDVSVHYEGFDAYDVEPKEPPDVFAERPVIVHGKWRGERHGGITVSGTGGAGPYSQRFDVSQVTPRAENRAITDLWARARIGSLSDYGFGEPSDETKKDITALGLKYSLLTAYTSFIAVSEVVRNPGAPATDVDQPLPLPAGVSASAVGGGVTGAPEPGLLLLGFSVTALFGGMAFARRARREAVVG